MREGLLTSLKASAQAPASRAANEIAIASSALPISGVIHQVGIACRLIFIAWAAFMGALAGGGRA
jgi:hypothetical protein